MSIILSELASEIVILKSLTQILTTNVLFLISMQTKNLNNTKLLLKAIDPLNIIKTNNQIKRSKALTVPNNSTSPNTLNQDLNKISFIPISISEQEVKPNVDSIQKVSNSTKIFNGDIN
jgi:nitrogen regulatory protein PII